MEIFLRKGKNRMICVDLFPAAVLHCVTAHQQVKNAQHCKIKNGLICTEGIKRGSPL
jgi:hypothetical protein